MRYKNHVAVYDVDVNYCMCVTLVYVGAGVRPVLRGGDGGVWRGARVVGARAAGAARRARRAAAVACHGRALPGPAVRG